jgi:hypothetical protein
MIIPESAYRLTEKMLRDRWLLVARAEQRLFDAQARAAQITAPATDAIRVQGSGGGSRAERAALAVLDAEKRLEAARAWLEAIRLADKAFPWESSPEGVIAGYLYGNGLNLADAARAAGCTRKTAKRLRDNYVGHCAIFAASMGLITFEEEKEK